MEDIKVLISEEELQRRIRELSKEIAKDYQDEEVVFCVVLKGAVFFAIDLMKKYEGKGIIDFIKVSSYDGENSRGKVELEIPLKEKNIKGKNVLLIEDIVDTGRTFTYLIHYIKKMQPKSFKTCTLLDKTSRRMMVVDVDYKGFNIDDYFVIGYGLDYNEKYRHLPYIGYLENK